MENKIFTVENVPKELDRNQFYCLNKTNGQILLGKILGKALDEHYYFFKVENNIYRAISRNAIDLSSTYIGFDNYGSLESYIEFDKLLKLDKTEKKENYKYCVNKCSYQYSFTDPDCLFDKSYYKIFDTKKEAEEYSLKGLKKVKKYSLLFTDKLDTLLEEVKEKQRSIGIALATLDDFIVKDPNELKVGDCLLKIEKYEVIEKNFPYILLKGIKSEFKLKVEEIISDQLIRLNDDIILEEYDFIHNYTFFKEENIEKVKLAIMYSNLDTIKSMIKQKLMYLKKLYHHCEFYENKSLPKNQNYYFTKISYEKLIEVVNNFLITNKIKMSSYDYQK